MIVAVKRNRKNKFIKIVSVIILLAMFGAYYYHMNITYSEKIKIELEEKRALKLQEEKKEKEKKRLKELFF